MFCLASGPQGKNIVNYYQNCPPLIITQAVGHFDLSGYPTIKAWFEKVKGEIPDYEEVNGKGAADMGKWYDTVTGGKK